MRLRARLLRGERRTAARSERLHLVCCRSHVEDRAATLAADRRQRMPAQALPERLPSQHFINWLFHQGGEHQNLFDLELLAWVMREAGFLSCTRVTEADLLARFPEFPVRGDDLQSIYVRAQ